MHDWTRRGAVLTAYLCAWVLAGAPRAAASSEPPAGGGPAKEAAGNAPPETRKAEQRAAEAGEAEDAEDDEPLTSIVVLRTRVAKLDASKVKAAIARSLGEAAAKDVLDIPATKATPASWIFEHEGSRYIIHDMDAPYFDAETVNEITEQMSDGDARTALKRHRAWLSVDLLNPADKLRAEADRGKLYIPLGRLAAELIDTRTVLLYSPEFGSFALMAEGIRETLRGDDPVSAFDDSANVPVVGIEADDPEMRAAEKEARDRFGEITKAWQKRVPDQFFAVKASFRDGENVEHMWVSVRAIDGEKVTGVLDNDPIDVKNIKRGDTTTVKLSELEDWLYTDPATGEMQGGFTVAVMEKIQQREADKARKDKTKGGR